MHALPINSQKNMHYQASFTDTISMQSNKKRHRSHKRRGKIQAKKPGSSKVTATVTMKNGKKKNVKMKVKVS